MTFMEGERDVDWLLDDEEASGRPGFCAACGYAFSVHNSQKVGPPDYWKGPFGCPPGEQEARERWGR